MKLIERFFPSKKLREHKQIMNKTTQAVDKLMAALDGETGWFDCGCVEKPEPESAEEIVNHGTLTCSKQRQCIN